MPRENWFFAFPLDGSFLEALPALPAGFRRYHADDVHLTLAFLGGCGEVAALRALAVLDEMLQREAPSPLEVTLGEVSAMGSKRAYTALAALLDDGRQPTESLITALRDPLTDAAGGRRERRPAKAHVTLARPRHRASDAQRELGLAWAGSLDLRSVRARLDKVALYRWSENRTQRLFRIVEQRTLG
ncbi:MAG: 2'-5' RNA ligase family protein [Polyangiaceae bacterium]